MSGSVSMNLERDKLGSVHTHALSRAISSLFTTRENPDHAESLERLCERLIQYTENGITHLLAEEYSDICKDPSVYSAVGEPSAGLPLVLTLSGSLYFRRFYEYEKEIADSLAFRASQSSRDCSSKDIEFFNSYIREHVDESQALAIGVGLQKSLVLLTGGPGTGKTHTLAHLLACMFDQTPDLSVALAAPTGKSAHRMSQSISGTLHAIELPSPLREKLHSCSRASTVHRLLGPVHGSVDFKRNTGNPLPHDVVVVDEASMVDLPLMAKLCSALRKDAALILVGDADQLSPVQGGAVYNALIRHGTPNHFCPAQQSVLSRFSGIGKFEKSQSPLYGCMVSLSRSHRRFQGLESAQIDKLCDAIKEGRAEDAVEITQSSDQSLCLIESLDDPWVSDLLRDGYGGLLQSHNAEDALVAMNQFRVLCAHNQGRYGVDGWNDRVRKLFPDTDGQPLPVVISSNDYSIGLFNGDDGVFLNNQAHFLSEDGIRPVSRARLPDYSIGYATTIHRSQGSEFDRVLIVLPPADARLLTRELLYVAVSRARLGVVLVGDPSSLISAVNQPEKSRCGIMNLLD